MAGKVLEWNPILLRETRARFRHWGAFALLFGYAALLALAMGLNYADAASRALAIKSPLVRLSAMGHELFLTLTWMQALAWVLIAPALTAASIAREREDGLLESVLLSPLAPARILAGKLLSAFSFILVLILASLPVQAVCFMTGGVSPGDFFKALLLHIVTALAGAVIGLTCSAWSRRANIALRSAYVLVVAWLAGSAICLGLAAVPVARTSSFNIFIQQLAAFFGWTNPIIAAISIVETDTWGMPALASSVFENAPWLISVLFQLLLCALLLPLSTLALRRPFEARDEAKQSRLQKPVTIPAPSTPMASATQPEHDWIEIPGTSQLVFSNPVLQREARGKFRMKAPPLWALIGEGLLAMLVAYFYLLTLWAALFQPRERETIWWVIVFIALFIVALAASVMGASTFTREREGQTWNALRLSLLQPREIIGAKLGAILLSFVVYSVPVWPLLLPCVHLTRATHGLFGSGNGVSIVQALAALGITAATAFAYALWGMWWSWRCKRTVVAVGWTLGSLFFLLVFFPVFLGVAFSQASGVSEDFVWCFHPFVAMGYVAGNEEYGLTISCIVVLLVAGACLWKNLQRQLNQNTER